jgi:hypothetical protein
METKAQSGAGRSNRDMSLFMETKVSVYNRYMLTAIIPRFREAISSRITCTVRVRVLQEWARIGIASDQQPTHLLSVCQTVTIRISLAEFNSPLEISSFESKPKFIAGAPAEAA